MTSAGRYARALIAIIVVAAAPAADACGYHDPTAVSRGMLNWVYPNSLYVRTAVWQAEDAGILPARAAKPVLDMFAFQRISAALRSLGERINAAHVPADDRQGVSVVLIESVLWTRFVRTPQGYDVQVHADGPIPGDVVIVSDGKVIQALVQGTITSQTAEEHGLLRFYGAPQAVTLVKESMGRTSLPRQTDTAQISRGPN